MAGSLLSLSLLLSLGIFATGCGRTDGTGILSGIGQSRKVPQDVIEIIRAIDAGDMPRLRGLLESGASPTPTGSPLSPIHAAIKHFRDGKLVCDSTALKLLLDHGADPDFVDQDSGFAPLEDALAMGDLTCAGLLKDAGADINRRGHSGQSILQFAVKGAMRIEDNSILKLVLSWGVDPNILSDGRAWTALHQAVASNPGQDSAPVVAELLHSGTDPCIADGTGQTALDMAVNLKRSAAVQQMLTGAMKGCLKS